MSSGLHCFLLYAAFVVAAVAASCGGAVPSFAGTGAPPGDGAMFVRYERSVALLHEGREELLQLRLARSDSLFAVLARTTDGTIAAAFHREVIALLRFMMSDAEAHRDAFYARSDTLKRLLSDAPALPWRTVLEAEAHLHVGLARAKRGEYVRAAFAGKAAYKRYSRLAADHPDFYEAYKGLGLLHLAIGSAPRFYRRVLKLLGLSGSVAQGLRELRLAAEKSRFNREEAQVFLALVDMKLYNSAGDGGALLRGLYRAYPGSPLFAYLYGSFLYENRQPTAAERVFRSVAAADGEGDRFYVDYIDYYLADALFLQDRFAEAEPYYRRYLRRHAGPALKAMTWLRLGLTLEMQERRAEAVPCYAQVRATREYDSDAASERHARRLQHAPMTPQERRLLLGANAFDAGRFEEAHRLLGAVADDPAARRSDRAEAAYRRGRVFHLQEQPGEALAAYDAAVALHDDPLARWGPWARYYTGLLQEQGGDRAAAARSFEAALAYPDEYDYHKALERSAKVALARVKAL